jgi:hypothetical protein
VRVRVGRVGVLERHVDGRVGRGQPSRLGDRAVRPELAVGEDDLGAVETQEGHRSGRGGGRHDGPQAIALDAGDHGQRDARVAGRRLEDRLAAAGHEQAVALGGLDHGQGHAILDGTGGVRLLELRPQPRAAVRAETRQLDERRRADGREHVRAPARELKDRIGQQGHGSSASGHGGSTMMVPWSGTGVSSPCPSRTSSFCT